MRHFKLFIIILICSTFIGQLSFSQVNYSKILVNTKVKDTFSFPKQWDYSWEVFKDDSTGKFTRNDDRSLTAADTAHLFYTASCRTNIQGGYDIRYCNAEKHRNTIILTFADGLPAYASEFYIYIVADSFGFKPKTIYPLHIPGQSISYQVTKQKLTLNKNNYQIGDIIIGYVDTEFIETVSIPNKGTQKNKFYLRGYIRTFLDGRL